MLFKDDRYDRPEMTKRTEWYARGAMTALVLAAIAGLVFITSEMDYQDQKALERENCAMVEEGAYPAAAFPYCDKAKGE